MRYSLFGTILSLVVCIGCKNPFTDFYHDYTGGADPRTTGVVAVISEPERRVGNDPNADFLEMSENGFLTLGYSSFNGGTNVSWDDAYTQGKKVGAAVIMQYNPKLTGTSSGVYHQSIPTTTTSYSSGNATAYGAGGTVNAYGSGVTTTYGSQVVAVPYTVNRYDYMAVYWAKDIRPVVLGAVFVDLTPKEREEIGSNKGVRINVVVKGTPAFRADLMRNDIVKKIGDNEVLDVKQAIEVRNRYFGQTVTMEVLRNGQPKSIQVTLNKRP